MNMAKQFNRSGNAGLMVMIFLIIFTVIFGVGAFMSHKHIKLVRLGLNEPGSEVKIDNSISRLQDKIDDEKRSIREHEERISNLKRATHYYDLQIASLGEFYREEYKDAEDQVVPGAFLGLNGEGDVHTHHGQANKLIQHQHDILKMWEQHYGSTQRQDTPELKKAAKAFQDATNDIITEGGEQEDSINATIDRLNEELDKLKERRSALEADERTQTAIKQTRRGKLETQIRRLLELELRWLKQLESDGQILQTGVDYNFIIVNIGAKEGVKPGMRFEVFNHEKGTYLRKGMAEVIKVDRTISTCRIVIEDNTKKNPIAVGDHIGNPIFHAGKPKVFVLAGEFKMYNKDDLTYFIKKAGGEVSPDLRPGVDFLVASWRSESAQDKAREYDVLAMDEATLVKYLHTTFTTKRKDLKEKK